MKKKHDQRNLEFMSKDPANWRGLIYFNRKDPRIVVPKWNSEMGWSFNMANPYSYLILIALLGLILISALYRTN